MQQLSTYKILQRFHPFKLCTHFNTTHLPKEPVNFKAKGVFMTAVSDKSWYTCILQQSHILRTFAFSNISAFSSWRRFTAFEGWKTRLSCVRSYLIMTFLSQNNVWTSGFVVSILFFALLRKIVEQFLRIDLGVFLLMASGSEDEGGQLVAAQRRWERRWGGHGGEVGENGNFSGYPRMPDLLTPQKIGRFFRPSWGMMVVNESLTFPWQAKKVNHMDPTLPETNKSPQRKLVWLEGKLPSALKLCKTEFFYGFFVGFFLFISKSTLEFMSMLNILFER